VGLCGDRGFELGVVAKIKLCIGLLTEGIWGEVKVKVEVEEGGGGMRRWWVRFEYKELGRLRGLRG
jgi:hypothetical protein